MLVIKQTCTLFHHFFLTEHLTFSIRFYKMLPAKSLEINGILSQYPLAELLAESSFSTLSGSFRLTDEARKVIIYLREGEVVFAVSNSRQHRLFELLLSFRQITREKLTQFENVANDLEFGQKLVEAGLFAQSDIDVMFAEQLKQVLQNALAWKTGEWTYSPFARIKESIGFKVDLQKLLLDFARKLESDYVLQRFNGCQDEFAMSQTANLNTNLLPHEGFVYSRLDRRMKTSDIKLICGLPDTQILHSLYSLWLGGFAKRHNFSSAFSILQIERISAAKFKLSEQAVVAAPKIEQVLPLVEEEIAEVETVEKTAVVEDVTIESYLKQTAEAFSYYEVLGVKNTADISEIKQVYFNLARQFHPDKFHNEEKSAKDQLQNAFTQLAQAYDTLKDKDQRELYDFKLKRKITAREEEEEIKKVEKAKGKEADQEPDGGKLRTAKTYFERGFSLLMGQETEHAVPFLANAVNLAPNVARYHAYYGKSLVGNKKYRHQAEQELLSAVKLEQDNANFRIMLVEFYLEVNLLKRADGELQRLLELHPNNKEAKTLLDKMPKK
jgi:curved DNA-binding protein CbpA